MKFIKYFLSLLMIFLMLFGMGNFVHADDTIPPTFSNFKPSNNLVVPGKNFDIEITYSDTGGALINTSSAIFELNKWNGTSFASDISSTYVSSRNIGTTKASYKISSLPAGKYRYSFSIADNSGNKSKSYLVFYVDEPQIVINKSTHESSMQGVLNDDELIFTVKTIGVPYNLGVYKESDFENTFGHIIDDWNGSVGVGYLTHPYGGLGNKNDIPGNEVFVNGTPTLNSNGNIQTFTHKLKVSTIIGEIHVAGEYEMNLGFNAFFDYSTNTTGLVNGKCGTAAGVGSNNIPTSNLCANGTSSIVTSGTYYWSWECSGVNGGANAVCESPKTKINQSCTGLVANASWNTVNTITQAWNGTSWYPSLVGEFNTEPSTSECRFKCNIGYIWNSNTNACIPQQTSGNTEEFDYTGSREVYVAPVTGQYLLEVWGAEGGNSTGNYKGGKGGYSKGTVTLQQGDTVYVYVGGKGVDGTSLSYLAGETGANRLAGGFNGGGRGGVSGSKNSGGGGGGSDMRIGADSLFARVIVAGGGGASSSQSSIYVGGAGGGTEGRNGYNFVVAGGSGTGGGGGTQTAGGIMNSTYAGTIKPTAGEFGVGGKGGINAGSNTGGGGGGGWYGGGGGDFTGGAGGGAGYIFTSATIGNYPSGRLLATSYYLTDAITIAGDMPIPTFDGNSSMTGNEGNGHAKITLISSPSLNCNSQTQDGYLVPSTDNGDTQVVTKTVSVTGGTQTWQNTFTCNSGNFDSGTEVLVSLVCDQGYFTIDNITCIEEISIEGEEFDYSGQIITYTVPATGNYKLETWGAQGGSFNGYDGGKGAYAVSYVTLNKNDILKVLVGGQGAGRTTGHGGAGGGGGGSFIATSSNVPLSVAGAGGGVGTSNSSKYAGMPASATTSGTNDSLNNSYGGTSGNGGGVSGVRGGQSGAGFTGNGLAGGNSTGTNSVAKSFINGGTAGTVTGSHKAPAGFGGGGMGTRAGGGGGGYSGGAGGWSEGNAANAGGGGGSYYTGVGGYAVAGNAVMPSPNGGTMTGNSGNGFARITYLPPPETEFLFTGAVQTFTIATTGNYKLEVWGAQGGEGDMKEGTKSILGGKGGYSAGTVRLTAGTTLYVNVGGKGQTALGGVVVTGGFNGGGNAQANASNSTSPRINRGGGGGATDIRIGTNSLFARVIVAGGGGGAGGEGNISDSSMGLYGGPAGVGGGTTGTAGITYSGRSGGGGGTQTTGGIAGCYSGTASNCGTAGSFGQGGIGGAYSGNYMLGGGGGGGWYGGGGGGAGGMAGGGGAGYVYTSSTASSYPSGGLLNSSYYMSATAVTSGNTSMPTHNGSSTMIGNTGNGFAKITFVSN